ncbi:dihydrolipoyl dehydrogenase family protein [Fulvivirga sediminis]|uniref:NAD(P)/FAD-dependent oxidoreductase n=1 Tax=Fulvivirga sediminis TaxID=2803949 RepID=A0A937K2S5_9BACT|nr:NAD(P)/FAD-dependent oxidoreductase [Fulvivirga sediminis]MBL3658675.1 NAD(P)/FAD-dependent oxidoreductase [Fulvivirga sediminis]
MEKYDIVIIGAGPAGYAAAMRAIDFKKKTLLVEKESIGGGGVAKGALSSKTWWEISRDVHLVSRHLSRFNLEPPDADFNEIKREVLKAVSERQTMLLDNMTSLIDTHLSDLLTYREGTAHLLTPHQVQITDTDGKEQIVEAEYIILATGSRPRKLPNIPIDEKIIITSDSIEKLDDFPESMVIVGAGVIGCEFATIFSGFGKTKVHLIDKGDHILPFEDEDVVNVIERNMENNGVHIHRNSQLVRMEVMHGRVEYELEYTDGSNEVFNVEKALVAVGRVPNYENLWSDNVNITLNQRGVEDNQTQTSEGNIYAVGDLTADIALVNVGELEGRYAVERIFGDPARNLMYENISTIMFLNPEVAGVGLNEQQAIKKGISYKVVTLDYRCIPRAIAKRNTQGFIKLLVTNDDKMRLLGMRVVGNQASSAIQAVALLISMDKGVEELAECVHPHPSITEGIQECARMLMGTSLLKPESLKGHLSARVHINGAYEDILA